MDIKDYQQWTGVMTSEPELVRVLQEKFKSTEVYTRDRLRGKKFI